ncbi:hypothetical protein [Nonomuraea sp. NPDC050783]
MRDLYEDRAPRTRANAVPRADVGTATAGSMLTRQLGGSFGWPARGP